MSNFFGNTAFGSGSTGLGTPLRTSEVDEAKKEIKQTSFESLINDTRFSDVQVVVGPEEVVYSLHRNFLAHRSDFFGRVLDSKWKEHKDEMVRLPEIHPQAFRVVLTWIYGGAFVILDHKEYLSEIYSAADYLQIPDFKDSFFKQLISAIKSPFNDFPQSAKRPCIHSPIPTPFILLGKLLAIAPEAEYSTLQEFASTLTTYFEIPWEGLHPLVTKEPETINAKVLFYMIAAGLDGYGGRKKIPAENDVDVLRGLARAKTRGVQIMGR